MADYLVNGQQLTDIADAIRTKTGTTGGIETSEMASAINSISTGSVATTSNPNLLINSNFRNPVNQRGQTTYNKYWAYTIDRWILRNSEDDPTSKLTVNSNSISICRGDITQIVEVPAYVPESNYTISISMDGTVYTATTNVLYVDGDGVWGEYIGNSVSYDISRSSNSIIFSIGAYESVNIEWVKLEVGSEATEYVPKSYVEELNECRRYYYTYGPRFIPVVSFDDMGSYALFFTVPIHTPFRTTPTVTIPEIS